MIRKRKNCQWTLTLLWSLFASLLLPSFVCFPVYAVRIINRCSPSLANVVQIFVL